MSYTKGPLLSLPILQSFRNLHPRLSPIFGRLFAMYSLLWIFYTTRFSPSANRISLVAWNPTK
ncbi:uncharacterized protein BDR25DRAFT_114974 [Lindgomyces ingoldianus]|uniref:Uncharacterized protein n=1 Tax=Lindgomyces ingoldianus TaxID=673940 RepID=A0ACB6QA66_9PLEO|nr:uncharacterized protein BDR25DRAFT_114974 [Lindgomyces ingoldianus]KAF2463272.1 hypothetical protein BDR25DRAFT_114974 [Lindgomyces ingoldianus]